jgi:hypothetical protein
MTSDQKTHSEGPQPVTASLANGITESMNHRNSLIYALCYALIYSAVSRPIDAALSARKRRDCAWSVCW